MSVQPRVRIALVSDAVAPFHVGGKETRYNELVRRLPAHGVDITICTMKWWDGAPPPEVDGVRYRAICRRLPLYRSDGRRSMVQALGFAGGCLRLMAGRFDVIEADHMPGPQLLSLWVVAKLRRTPLQASWHEVWGTAYWREYLGGPGASIAALVERVSAHCPDRILANSRGTADRLVEVLGVDPSRVHLVENGLDLDTIASVAAVPSAELLYAGRLIDHKRVDVLLSSVRELLAAGRPVRLDVIGDGPERSNLERLAVDLGIAHLVRFLGQLESVTEVWAHMKGARVFVSASEREGFGLSAVEAMACGTPVVVADHPDNEARRFIRPGLGESARAGSSFAHRIASLLDDPVDRAEIRSRFSSEFPSLDWNHCAASFAAVCRVASPSISFVPA